MSWTLNSYSDVRVYRATNGEAPEPVAYLDFPSTRWLDHDTNPEDTYVYSVAAVGVNQEVDDGPAQGESARCGHLEVGAVPFFPGAIGLVAGLVATAVGAWAMRRS